MYARSIPAGVMLMHVRSVTAEDNTLNKLNYPTWYFLKPTPLLFVPTKTPPSKTPPTTGFSYFAPNRDESLPTLDDREYTIVTLLSKQNNIAETSSIFSNIVKPLAKCYRDNLKIDIFKVTEDLPLLFVKTNNEAAQQNRYLNALISKDDKTFRAKNKDSRVEGLQRLFDNKTNGVIIEQLDQNYDSNSESSDEAILNQQAVPYVGFLGTINVRRYLEYVKSI